MRHIVAFQDVIVSFKGFEDKRNMLRIRVRRLERWIRSDDMNVLHQRIRLLSMLWEELLAQVQERENCLHQCTFRWPAFLSNVKQLLDWINKTEVDVVLSRNVHIEDFLIRLNTVRQYSKLYYIRHVSRYI